MKNRNYTIFFSLFKRFESSCKRPDLIVFIKKKLTFNMKITEVLLKIEFILI